MVYTFPQIKHLHQNNKPSPSCLPTVSHLVKIFTFNFYLSGELNTSPQP